MTTQAIHIEDYGVPLKKITVTQIKKATCAYFGITHDELVGPCRKYVFSRPRQIAMFLARKHTSLSFPQISSRFDRDHSTAVHAIQRLIERLDSNKDPSWMVDVVSIENSLGL
jgi:chromosomal replication initiator protein